MEKAVSAKQRLGTLGESAACEYLLSLGYTLVERNFRAYGVRGGYIGEIDIVARDGTYTVFTEVKARSVSPSSRFGRAADAVNYRKQLSFVNAVKVYQRTHPETLKCRIDVIEVYFPRQTDTALAEIRHIKSAFGDITKRQDYF